MVVILLGPPGVGKGTQGVLLSENLDWEHLSTGDLLRAHRQQGTALGDEAKKYMDAGELVPDQIIVGMVGERLKRLPPESGILFDGFPRTAAQAEALDEVLGEVGRRVDRVVVLEAPDEVLIKRISGRRSCSECGAVYNVHFDPPEAEGECDRCDGELAHREDDRPETVQKRLEVYREETEPLIEHYEESPAPVQRVDGDQSVTEVQGALRAALGGQATGGGQADEHAHHRPDGG